MSRKRLALRLGAPLARATHLEEGLAVPGNALVDVGGGVGEALGLSRLAAEDAVEVGADLVGAASLGGVALSATGLEDAGTLANVAWKSQLAVRCSVSVVDCRDRAGERAGRQARERSHSERGRSCWFASPPTSLPAWHMLLRSRGDAYRGCRCSCQRPFCLFWVVVVKLRRKRKAKCAPEAEFMPSRHYSVRLTTRLTLGGSWVQAVAGSTVGLQ